ncbi:MAG: tyrosine-type recombinase/integrase, partial [Oscillospiraceae bacterium]|nr:tyrosine-type recombinase/integrase [Oscillospiraceae bacterium]
YKVLAARKRQGLEEKHQVMITRELAATLTRQAEQTAPLRAEYRLPFIFITKHRGFKATMLNPSYFLIKLDELAKKHKLCGEDGKPWHFTARQYRKTLAVELIENGGSMEELSQLLGHLSRATSATYYAEVRKLRLAEMNKEFFNAKFELRLSGEQLSCFSEAERRALYVDFCLESRRVELGYCLKKLSDGPCGNRSSLVNCVNCRNLCTGPAYLPYWEELYDQQRRRIDALLAVYQKNGIAHDDYEELPEYRQEQALLAGYEKVLVALKGGER